MHKCLDKDECLTNGIPSPKDGLPPKNFSAPNLSDDEVVAIIFLIDEELPLIAVLDNEDIWGILIWFGSHYWMRSRTGQWINWKCRIPKGCAEGTNGINTITIVHFSNALPSVTAQIVASKVKQWDNTFTIAIIEWALLPMISRTAAIVTHWQVRDTQCFNIWNLPKLGVVQVESTNEEVFQTDHWCCSFRLYPMQLRFMETTAVLVIADRNQEQGWQPTSCTDDKDVVIIRDKKKWKQSSV